MKEICDVICNVQNEREERKYYLYILFILLLFRQHAQLLFYVYYQISSFPIFMR